ncbi:S53 family peptidase [Paracidobacterium acidisoli]|uniref:Peptidase S53 n=1 Tax=Paracidobacterium acidisoli TaxID=2303751 RepID=A0A372IQL3_9BACT|nr:S53 family serine peptidase [Paracidobacterium acidisoli]MBT9331411.1 S53 family serine peptidase [Paracidobacterium acidisoli]
MHSPLPKRITLARSERKAPRHASRGGRTDGQKIISVSVIVKRKNPLDLKALGGRHVSHEEFAEKYAADPASFDALRRFAHQHGLTVDESASSLARRTIVLRGPARAMEQAFGVELHDYEDERTGRSFHGFEGTVTLPETHAGLVEAVLGLDARPVARPHFRKRDGVRPRDAAKGQAQSFNPQQVAALYGFPASGNGAGQAVGIIELGGGYSTSDLESYFSGIGITPPHVVAVSVDGGTNSPGDPNGADGEVALDIEVVGAIAPGATIAVYFTTNTDQGFMDAITTAVHDTTNNPKAISISWGGPEDGWAQSAAEALDGACQSAAALGVTITVASGDSGSSDGESDGANHVDFPASSPHVLGCGGTELIASGSSIQSEVVWDDQSSGGGASGGGVSNYFALPSWQASAGVPAPAQSGGGRGVPDVAGDASPETGYNVYFDGQSEVVGGTSAVAPLWAALITLINQQRVQKGEATAGFVNPALYAATSAFRDITQGNNGSFSAGPGWDACTGLGSPNGQAVAQALS